MTTTYNLQEPVLVVDDEADLRDLMEMTLMKMGLQVETAVGVEDAKSKLEDNDYSLVLTDMRMPDGSGLEVVQYINQLGLDTPVAVITAYGNAEQAVEALKSGAFDYLQKPITLAQLRSLVKSAVKINEPPVDLTNSYTTQGPSEKNTSLFAPPVENYSTSSQPESEQSYAQKSMGIIDSPIAVPTGLRSLKEKFKSESAQQPILSQKMQQTQPPLMQNIPGDADMPRLLGSSPHMVEARHLIRRLARSDVPVYISGESGTGKEQAARSIHELSPRANKPFIAVNCGAIPENLMESEFFGYKKGSFTGADQDRMGFFQHAAGGTLFLDEVADLPLAMQVKLLRAIQEKAVRRIGDAHESAIDVRIVCATHKNLDALVATGAFRQDLYYRLNVVSLSMPPLREMREDLGGLIVRLLNQYNHGDWHYRLSTEAQKMLLHYSYPGNFRELENILERAVALAANETIQVEDLQINAHIIENSAHEIPEIEPSHTHLFAAEERSETILPPFVVGEMSIQDYLDDVERLLIEQSLSATRYNRTQAAKRLGVSFRSMRYRMDRLGIE